MLLVLAPDLVRLRRMLLALAVPAVLVEARLINPLVVPLPVQVLPDVARSNSLPVVIDEVVA